MTTPTSTSTTPRTRIEDLSDLTEIGRGAAATVYRCTRPAGSPAAVKIFNAVAPDDAPADQYRREEEALRRLPRHPAIIALEARGRTGDGRPFLVLELTERSLGAMVAENGPMPWEHAVTMAVTVAGALETAHRCGVVHCDVGSANIHRVGTRWRLADFGASCSGPADTDDAARPFTLDHAAPEAIRGEPGTVGRDVYGLASTLFHALAGKPPFGEVRNDATEDIVDRITTEPPPDLRAVGVPDELCQVIERALSKDPDLRPVSSAVFAEELAAAVQPLGVSLTPPLVLAPVAPGLTVVPDDLVGASGGPVVDHPPPPPKRTGGRFAPALVGVAAAALAFGAAVPVIADAVDDGPSSLVLGDQPTEVGLAAEPVDEAAEVDDAGDDGDAEGDDEASVADAVVVAGPVDGATDGQADAGAGGGAPQRVATVGNGGGGGNGPGNGDGVDNAGAAAPAGNDGGGGGDGGGGRGNGGRGGNGGGDNGPGGPQAT